MRSVVCPSEGCRQLRADTDELLARAVLEHALTRHPGLGFDERRARAYVHANGDDEPTHGGWAPRRPSPTAGEAGPDEGGAT